MTQNVTQYTVKGKAINEVQAMTQAVVAGTTATTDIAVTGITVADTIVGVIMFAAGVPSDVTSEASVTSAGNIQLSTTNSTGNQLLVTYIPSL